MSFVSPRSDSATEMNGIPVNDDCGEQVEPGNPVVLSLRGAVTDFALATDAQRILECVRNACGRRQHLEMPRSTGKIAL